MAALAPAHAASYAPGNVGSFPVPAVGSTTSLVPLTGCVSAVITTDAAGNVQCTPLAQFVTQAAPAVASLPGVPCDHRIYLTVGLAATAMNGGNHRTVAVLKSAPAIPPPGINGAPGVPKTNPAQLIQDQQAVFVDGGGGVSGGLSQSRAIGVAKVDSAAGATTVAIALDTTFGDGAPGASLGQAAAGTAQATAYVINLGDITQITSASASANGAMLGIIPVGTSEIVCNDSTVTVNVYPQAGGTIQGLPQNAAAPLNPGTCAAYRRLSQTLWHQ